MDLRFYKETKAYTEYNLSEKIKGDFYPYTLDNLKIKIANNYPKAVWVEDAAGNKYAVNGNAFIYLSKIKKDKKLIGYTTDILKNGYTDTKILNAGFTLYDKREILKTFKDSCFYYVLDLLFTIFISYLAFTDVQPGWFIKTCAVFVMLIFASSTKKIFEFWRDI